VFSRIVVVEVTEGGSVAEDGDDALNGGPTPTKRKKDATEGNAMCE
jgi:hypothetical protein